jgi:hypothetical protein
MEIAGEEKLHGIGKANTEHSTLNIERRKMGVEGERVVGAKGEFSVQCSMFNVRCSMFAFL